ncbi:helix-turn-helix domain-containing protein [Amycolatopsis sp. WQ 127309]|uniref:helix-turn-helix domain-containing protein n=1 Tax=Amycolatopsis sp. WQ 127309 TaxID=2932773 RepID=UPI0035302BC7
MFAATEGYVREVIHAFNTSGFVALSPKWSGGRPRKFGPAARDQILPHRGLQTRRAEVAVHDLEPDQAGRLPRRALMDPGEH